MAGYRIARTNRKEAPPGFLRSRAKSTGVAARAAARARPGGPSRPGGPALPNRLRPAGEMIWGEAGSPGSTRPRRLQAGWAARA
eukprot:5781476-Heterocapsa_arctica.AAC.1